MRPRRVRPSADVGQHDPGADHVGNGAASLINGTHHDLKGSTGSARETVADVSRLAVGNQRYGAEYVDTETRTDGAAEANVRLKGRCA
jgi:hypothetical protein